MGLSLNNSKSEIICNDPVTKEVLITSLSEAPIVDPSDACLLGSSLENVDSISNAIQKSEVSTGNGKQDSWIFLLRLLFSYSVIPFYPYTPSHS